MKGIYELIAWNIFTLKYNVRSQFFDVYFLMNTQTTTMVWSFRWSKHVRYSNVSLWEITCFFAFSEESIEDGSCNIFFKYNALGKENTNPENPLEYSLYTNMLPVGRVFECWGKAERVCSGLTNSIYTSISQLIDCSLLVDAILILHLYNSTHLWDKNSAVILHPNMLLMINLMMRFKVMRQPCCYKNHNWFKIKLQS